ncbi:MAG: immune inhibitor A [Caldilinea sp.]|nr:immune inhibitor A [Caldilinea sp.]
MKRNVESRRIEWLTPLALLVTVLSVTVLLAACTAMSPVTPQPIPTIVRTAPPSPTPEPTAVPAALLATLDTEAQVRLVEPPSRDPRRLTERLNPDIDHAPIFAEPKVYQSGDRERFWVHNSDTKQNIEITAELIYQTAVANVWVEVDQVYDGRRIRQSIDRFSNVTYPALVNLFGSESNPGIDGDPRLHVLHTTQMGAGVAGYFYSADKYTRVVNPFSNEKEIFFINLNWLNRLRDYTSYETVLAHEFQHMIHWNQDRGEELWINEGLSEYAQEVAGYDPDINFAYIFLREPDLPLKTWNPNPGANAPHYGASYLFVAYLAQRFGDEFLGVLVAEPRNGANGVDQALATMGIDATFDDLFADWVVANWADAPDALDGDGRFGYRRFDLADAGAAATITAAPVAETAAQVANYGTDYLTLDEVGDVIFHFRGVTETQLADTTAPDGVRMWWSNRSDDANPRLTRQFDFSALTAGSPITMSVDMWWNIEETYDYGYVQVSRNGEDWMILPGQRTSTDNPTGNALGPGYTGVSGDAGAPTWVQEVFDLSEFAGGPLWVQFSYVTDDAVNTEGWLIDNMTIPALGYADSFEGDVTGWESEGWVLTDNRLPQRWLLQLMEFDGDRLTNVTRVPVDTDGAASIAIDGLSGSRHAVIAISGMTRKTVEPAQYTYWIE